MATTTIMGRYLFAIGAFVTTSVFHYGHEGFNYLLGSSNIARTDEAEKDRIIKLPGLTKKATPKFEQFSGYLDAAETRHVFYWYVESETDPDEAPVVLWTNGGPGCSGLLGFGAEHGPFVLDGRGRLHRNHYSWNKIANMLYVEQPAGVGFSYTDSEDDKTTGDKQAASDNYNLIIDFFRKFPERRKNEFYIASESYGGHYVPQLALEVLQNDKEGIINFQGFLLGNPYVDPFSNMMTQFESYYSHGLLAKPLYDKWKSKCTNRTTYLSKQCEELTEDMFDQFDGDYSINPYALDYPVCLEMFEFTQDEETMHTRRLASSDRRKNKDANVQRTSSSQVDMLLNRSEPPFLPSQDEYKPCSQVHLERYLNNHQVRKALHVLDRASYKWSPCGGVNYSKDDVDTPVVELYQQLTDAAVQGHHDLKMLIYSGDDDSICSTAGTQDWIWNLGMDAIPGSMWQHWKVDGQTCGFVTHFDLGPNTNATFVFATVHGAGHEVPAYRPMEALQMFQNYLDGVW